MVAKEPFEHPDTKKKAANPVAAMQYNAALNFRHAP